MFPAYAGMIRLMRSTAKYTVRVPRLRGDDPIWILGASDIGACSPPTRG